MLRMPASLESILNDGASACLSPWRLGGCGGLQPQLGGEELVPGPAAGGVSRRWQQGAVADCPGARYPDRQHPAATMAGLQVTPKQVRPAAHLWSGHVRRPAGGLAKRQLNEP